LKPHTDAEVWLWQAEVERAAAQQQADEALLAAKTAELQEIQQKNSDSKTKIADEMRRYATNRRVCYVAYSPAASRVPLTCMDTFSDALVHMLVSFF
jgi:hypothetical protein